MIGMILEFFYLTVIDAPDVATFMITVVKSDVLMAALYVDKVAHIELANHILIFYLNLVHLFFN